MTLLLGAVTEFIGGLAVVGATTLAKYIVQRPRRERAMQETDDED
ncbi:hypothetical protein [Streptomyces mirabilis]|nr:hypothetical protein [Streptomyces mirabilis]MCX4429612.1 hypothetical protein [Streptomyces mirabilis]